MKSKHSVIYIGSGIWKDADGKLWNRDANTDDIKASREYETTMTEDEFLEKRQDIAFMVSYKAMKISTVSIDDAEHSTQVPAEQPIDASIISLPSTPTISTVIQPAQGTVTVIGQQK